MPVRQDVDVTITKDVREALHVHERATRAAGALNIDVTQGADLFVRIVKDAIGNVVISSAIEEVHGSIREGDTIADPLRAAGIFDELLVNMIDVGEETGELDKMLIKIADNYDMDVDVAVESMSSLLEPIIIVGMGLVVGFIVAVPFLILGLVAGISFGFGALASGPDALWPPTRGGGL